MIAPVLLCALSLQAAPGFAEPDLAPEPGRVHHNAAWGFFITPPEGWAIETAPDGASFIHPETGARMDVWAEPAPPSGVIGMPDDSLDALGLRIDGPEVRISGTTRLPLAAARDSGDPVRAGEIEALVYEGDNGSERWSGIAASRCGVDYYLVAEAPRAAFNDARAAHAALAADYALDLYGGDEFPCGGAR